METGIRERKHPDFVHFVSRNTLQDIEAGQKCVVIELVRRMRRGRAAECAEKSINGVAETIFEGQKFIHILALDELITRQSFTGLGDIVHITGDEIVGAGPAKMLGEFFSRR